MKKLFLNSVLILTQFTLNSVTISPVPWITQDAIIFLQNFLNENANAKILEFGIGASTLWLAKKTKNLVSIEHNINWFNRIKTELDNNTIYNEVNLIFKERPYHTVCDLFPDECFDLILIDGRNRKLCIMNSIRVLKKGGILMLDNAERPFYQCVIKEFLHNWEFHKTVQNKPDSCGFWYKNWQTNWWIKPS